MHNRIVVIVAAVALVAASCGSSSSDTEPGAPADQDSSATEEPADETEDPADETEDPGAADEDEPDQSQGVEEPTDDSAATGEPEPDASGLVSTAGEGWELTAIGEGTKPSLALDPSDTPGIAFLFEDVPEGFVAYADAADDWQVERFVEGYFYGPIGLDFDPDGRPNIAYHDHQAPTFEQDLGDLAYAVLADGQWQLAAASDDGHDGWDSTIRIGPDGVVRAAGIDPAQFGSPDGLEYYELVDGQWQVEAVGTGPIEYEWNVDLQVAPDGTPGLTYFRTESQDLGFASRAPDGTWTIETIDEDGDVGRFSSFAFDDSGNVHASYWHAETGEVRYATNANGTWEVESVDVLADVQLGFEGARRITALALDSSGRPHIAYSDVTGIWIAEQTDEATWASGQVISAGERPLGQLVSMELDADDGAHIAFFEVTANSPLAGVVGYVSAAG